MLSRSTIETKWSSSTYLGFCIQNTQAVLSKAPKIVTEQPLASSSAEPSNKYCCLCATLSKEWCRAGRKQERGSGEESRTEAGGSWGRGMWTYASNQRISDWQYQIKQMSTERCRIFLGENTAQKTLLWTKSCIRGQKMCCSWNRSECNFHHSISYWDYFLDLKITAFCQHKVKQATKQVFPTLSICSGWFMIILDFLIHLLLEVNIFPFMCCCLIISGWTFWDFWQI